MKHAARRAVIIYAIGFFLSAFPRFDMHTVRFAGVLARIAVVYLICSAIVLYTGKRAWCTITAVLLVGYWVLMTRVPGFDLTPDGNLAAFVDKKIMYEHLWVKHQWDPEGLLSTLPAIATCLLGVFAGVWLKLSPWKNKAGKIWGTPGQKAAGMFLAGVVGMCGGKLWDAIFPINKNLWTSSFVLLSGGIAAQVLALCHWLLDVRGWRGCSAPFAAFGRNALIAYFLSVGLDALLLRWTVSDGAPLKAIVYRNAFARWLAPCCGAETASLAYAIIYVALWAVVLMEMRRRRMFIGI